MRNPFVQKRCRQCGWELGFFNRRDFCSDTCVSTWDRNERESEEYKKEKLRKELNAIREMKDYQKYRSFKEKFEEVEGVTLTEEQLYILFKKTDENAKKYIELIKKGED